MQGIALKTLFFKIFQGNMPPDPQEVLAPLRECAHSFV